MLFHGSLTSLSLFSSFITILFSWLFSFFICDTDCLHRFPQLSFSTFTASFGNQKFYRYVPKGMDNIICFTNKYERMCLWCLSFYSRVTSSCYSSSFWFIASAILWEKQENPSSLDLFNTLLPLSLYFACFVATHFILLFLSLYFTLHPFPFPANSVLPCRSNLIKSPLKYFNAQRKEEESFLSYVSQATYLVSHTFFLPFL